MMTMRTILAAALGATLSAVPAAPVFAQAGGSALIIYGNDPCPAGTVCVRAPESERFRIPKTLRSGTLAPQDQPWSARAKSVANTGAATGTGSCTAVGGGGFTGCWKQQMQAARAENAQNAAAAAESPEPR
jgi:hypothetical protein